MSDAYVQPDTRSVMVALQRQSDSIDVGNRVRMVLHQNPYMSSRPDAVMALAGDPTLSNYDLGMHAGALYGMQTANTIANQLRGMQPGTQRAVYSRLSVAQQQTLSQQGYKAPMSDEQSLIGDILHGSARIGGGALNIVHNAVGPVLDPTLQALTWAGDQPAHLYRTIRTMDDDAQTAALVGAVIGGGAALALAPFTGGGSLATLGLVGAGALLGGTAGAIAATGPGDWWRAFQGSWHGEKTFDRASQQHADEILGDPRLVSMAFEFADSDYDMRKFSRDMAAVDAAGDQARAVKEIERIATSMATPGTPEYQSVYKNLVETAMDQDFQRAVVTLQKGKISLGRDVADQFFDPGSTTYNIVSGAVDATWIMAMDPTLVLGKAAQWNKARRMGMPVLEGSEAMTRFRQLSYDVAPIRKLHEGLAEAVRTDQWTKFTRIAPGMESLILPMRQARDRMWDLGVVPRGVFGHDEFYDVIAGQENLAPLMRGLGTVRGGKGVILHGRTVTNTAYRAVADRLRSFTLGLADPAMEKHYFDEIKRLTGSTDTTAGSMANDFLPAEVFGHISEAGMIDTPWRYGSANANWNAAGRAVGKIPGAGKVGEVVTAMSTMIPPGKAIDLVGPNAAKEIRAFTELGQMMAMPSWMRAAWRDSILASKTVGGRMTMMTGMLDNMLTLSGARVTEDGAAMVDEILHRFNHVFGAGGEDLFNVAGRPTAVGIWTQDAADVIVMPNLHELRKAAATGAMGKAMGIVDAPVLSTAVNKIWKPAVLLRFGFIFRAAGEEMANFVLRGGFGSMVQEFGARSVGHYDAWHAAKELADHAPGQLTPAMRDVLRQGPIVAHLRPLANMLSREHPLKGMLDRYSEFVREGLGDSSFFGGLRRGFGLDIPLPEPGGGTVDKLNSIFFGNPHSWRRMIAGGVDDNLVEAANRYYSEFSTVMMRELSATNAGAYDRGFNRSDVKTYMVDQGGGKMREERYVVMRHKHRRFATDDPHYLNATHQQAYKPLQDPAVSDVVRRHVGRVLPRPLHTNQRVVADALHEYQSIRDPTARVLLNEFLNGSTTRESLIAALGDIETIQPDLAKALRTRLRPGDNSFESVKTVLAEEIAKRPADANLRLIFGDLNQAQRYLDIVSGFDLETQRFMAASMRSLTEQGINSSYIHSALDVAEGAPITVRPKNVVYRGVKFPETQEILPDGSLRIHGQYQSHWDGPAISFGTSEQHAKGYAGDTEMRMMMEIDRDVLERVSGRAIDYRYGGYWPEGALGEHEAGLYMIGDNGEVAMNFTGRTIPPEVKRYDDLVKENDHIAFAADYEMGGDLAAQERAYAQMEDNRAEMQELQDFVYEWRSSGANTSVVDQAATYIDLPPGSWRAYKPTNATPENIQLARNRVETAEATALHWEEKANRFEGMSTEELIAGAEVQQQRVREAQDYVAREMGFDSYEHLENLDPGQSVPDVLADAGLLDGFSPYDKADAIRMINEDFRVQATLTELEHWTNPEGVMIAASHQRRIVESEQEALDALLNVDDSIGDDIAARLQTYRENVAAASDEDLYNALLSGRAMELMGRETENFDVAERSISFMFDRGWSSSTNEMLLKELSRRTGKTVDDIVDKVVNNYIDELMIHDPASLASETREEVVARLSERIRGTWQNPSMGSQVASDPFEWFDKMRATQRHTTEWGTMPPPQFFHTSIDGVMPDIERELSARRLNAHFQDESGKSMRMTGLDEGQVMLYRAENALGTTTFEDLVANADHPDVLIRNRDTVEALIAEPGFDGHSVLADSELAQEYNTALGRHEHINTADYQTQVINMDRKVLDGRLHDDGMLRPIASSQQGRDSRTEAWFVDSQMIPSDRFRPLDPNMRGQADEWAKVQADRIRQVWTKGTVESVTPRFKNVGKVTDTTTGEITDAFEPMVHQRVGNELTPVPRGEKITEKQTFFTDRGKPIPFGDNRYFAPGTVDTGAEGEVMWSLVGPMFEDVVDDLEGVNRLIPKEEFRTSGVGKFYGEAQASEDVVRAYRSKPTHVQDVGVGLPNMSAGPEMSVVKKAGWDAFVRFGFDRVIGPSIDALARRPMAFHFFAQRFEQNKAMIDWLVSPELREKVADISGVLMQGKDPNDVREIANHARTVAWFDGEAKAKGWTDQQALAWIRGHDRQEWAETLTRVRDNAVASPIPFGESPGTMSAEAKVAHNAAYYLRSRPMAELNAIIAPGINHGEMLAVVRSKLPAGTLDSIDNVANQTNRIANDPMLSKLSKEDWDTLVAAETNWKHINKAAGEYAAEAAINDMMPFIDSHELRTQFSEYGKGFLPFWYAEENFLKRWARTVILDPTSIRKAQLGYMGLKQAGVIRSDASGRDWFVGPGSTPMTEVIEKVFPGELAKGVNVLFQSPTDTMLPGVNSRFGTPQFSPLVTLPLDLLQARVPEVTPLNRALVGDFNAGKNAFEQLIPSHLYNMFDAVLSSTEGSKRYASAQTTALAILEATGQIPDNMSAGQRDEVLRKVQDHARIIVASQGLLGFFSPGPPGQIGAGETAGGFFGGDVKDPRQVLSSLYSELVSNLGIEEGTQEFLKIYPLAGLEDIVNPLALVVGQTETKGGAPLPATENAISFYDANPNYFAEFPDASPWLLPQDPLGQEAHSQYAYDQQTIAGLRKRRTPGEFLDAMKFKEAAGVYFDNQRKYLDALDKAKLSGDRGSQAALTDYWQSWTSIFKAAHPIFTEQLESSDNRETRRRVLEQMRYIVDDPNAPRAPHFEALSTLMHNFSSFETAIATMSTDRSRQGVLQRENVRSYWAKYLDDQSKANPALASFILTVIQPESGL